jgi:TrmH family RNA methyltransferase
MLTKAEIQRLRSRREKKNREASRCFLVEGEKVVRELLGAGFPFLEVYEVDAGAAGTTLPAGTQRHEITAAEMARISHFPTPSRLLAVGSLERRELPAGALDEGLSVVLDGVQDAGNVGTILRVADWFGAARVVLSPDSADLFSQKVINASMGSFARVKVYTADLSAALEGVRVPVLGCDLEGEDLHQIRGLGDAVVVIGSEGSGLSAAVRRRITRFVTIKRFGGAESLNAGVAAGIVLDSVRRR